MRRILEGGAKEESNDLLTLKHSKEKEERNRDTWKKVGFHPSDSDICVHRIRNVQLIHCIILYNSGQRPQGLLQRTLYYASNIKDLGYF